MQIKLANSSRAVSFLESFMNIRTENHASFSVRYAIYQREKSSFMHSRNKVKQNKVYCSKLRGLSDRVNKDRHVGHSQVR